MTFNYYFGSQAEQFSFVRIPRIMLTEPAFQELSLASKVLYGVLLDRMSLSMKNNWFDDENRVYIIYQIGEIQEDLGLTKRKAMDLLSELEDFGLLEKKRRGHGLPNILYVKSFMTDIMIALIGVLQAVGTLLVGIGGVVLKAAAVLMFGAAGLLFFISDFSGLNALVVILLSTVMFWLPELFALMLVGLAFLQGKIADTFM